MVSDLACITEDPPRIEWWDAPFVLNADYDNLIPLDDDHPMVTSLVQHPVAIEPSHEAAPPKPRPIMLTRKEMKKMRRQNRLEVQQEKRDKV